MKILWLDDFNRATTNAKRITFVSILGAYLSNIRDKLDQMAKADDSTEEQLQNLLQRNGNPIYWYNGLVTGLDGFIKEESSFDFVILDADLPIDEKLIEDDLKEAGPETKNIINIFRKDDVFPKDSLEAGFTVYFYLVESGFPLDRIVFLSANASSAQEIKAFFFKAKATPPKIFDKSESAVAELIALLNNHSENSYITLRRGIINGCNKVGKLIEQDESRIQFRKFLRNEITSQNMPDYLDILKNFLPVREPQGDEKKRKYYKLFLRTLAHEWDSADPRKFDRTENGVFCQVMKHCRNWASHSKVLDDLNEQDTAFLFLVAIRAMFELDPQKVICHEKILLGLFENVPAIDEMKQYVGTSFRNRQIPLAKTYHAAQSTADNEGVRQDTVYFDGILNAMQKARVQPYDYVTGLYQIFWHGLSNAYLMPHRQYEQVYINFAFHDYGRATNGFLFEFARHIYKRSFKGYLR